jgi:hypothetical protein
MREDRGLNGKAISDCLAAHYGLAVASVTFLPIGNDFQAAVTHAPCRGAATLVRTSGVRCAAKV